MLEGRSASERMTASPRKMCVPGVQACAIAGVSTSASRTASAMRPDDLIPCGLDADALALPPDCFAEIVQLVLHDVVDRAARGIDVIAHLFDHFVDRNPVHHLLATVHGCSESALRTRSSPARAFHGALAGPPGSIEAAVSRPPRTFSSGQTRERRAAPSVA